MLRVGGCVCMRACGKVLRTRTHARMQATPSLCSPTTFTDPPTHTCIPTSAGFFREPESRKLKTAKKSKTSKRAKGDEFFPARRAPCDSMDWLAQYDEEGQTFDNYVDFVTMRSGVCVCVCVCGNQT